MDDETESLKQIADDINALYWRSDEAGDDVRLELAAKLVIAENKLGAEWEKWAAEHLDLSASYLQRMLAIGKATDPKAALAAERKKTRDRVRKHREALRTGPAGAAGDTHIEIKLPAEVSGCADEGALLGCLHFQKRKGRWLICIAKAAPLVEAA